LLGAIIIKLAHPLSTSAEINQAVLANPEIYLQAISLVLIALQVAATWWLGVAAYRVFGRWLPVLLLQAAPFANKIILKHGVHVKPEPMLVLALTLLVIAVLKATGDEKRLPRHALAMGSAIGFGVAVKVLFFPIGLLPLFLLKSWRNIFLYGLAAGVSFLFFIAPALPSLHIFIDWMAKVSVSSGAYGSGEGTFISSEYPRAFLKIFWSRPLFLWPFLAGLGAILWNRFGPRRETGPLWSVLQGVLLAQFAMLALVAKQPVAYYLIPALLLSGLTLAILVQLFADSEKKRLGVSIAALALAVSQGVTFYGQDKELRATQRMALSFDMTRFASCSKVYYDFASSPDYALYMGNIWSSRRFTKELEAKASKDAYFFNFYTGRPERWDQPVDLKKLVADSQCTIFRGAWENVITGQVAPRVPGIKYDGVCKTGEETIFTVGIGCAK
jgi:hypothetical protein